jgi:DNA-directed RNA polymerase subunit RPC12/RpoP
MKTYACLKCGRTFESSEFAHEKGRLMIRRRCPACGAPVSLSGATLVVAGLLWGLMFGMIPTEETELTAIVVGIVFVTAGVVRLVLQKRAKRAAKCEQGAACNRRRPG